MDVRYRWCAGLDVHKETVAACVRKDLGGGRVPQEVRPFRSHTSGRLALADWLTEAQVSHAAMGSTGVYGKPVWDILEGVVALLLVNAARIKQVPGRKTDVKDSQWIAELLQRGLLQPSFVPERPMRDLRDLTRQRVQLVRQKVQAPGDRARGERPGSAGRPGAAAVAGEDPAVAGGALGETTEHHRFLLGVLLEQVAFLEGPIARLGRGSRGCCRPLGRRPWSGCRRSPGSTAVRRRTSGRRSAPIRSRLPARATWRRGWGSAPGTTRARASGGAGGRHEAIAGCA